MIRWCSYCQAYAGEVEPFDDHRLTHTICERCSNAAAWEDTTRIDRARELRDFHDRLREAARSGSLRSSDALLAEATERGISAVDLAVGMLQPVLREVGELWHRGEVSVAIEHLASSAVHDVFARIHAARPDLAALRCDDRPDILLVPAPGNVHVLGVELMELILLERGVRCAASVTSHSLEALVAEVKRRRPRILGVSVALPEQLSAADALADRVGALGLEPPPTVVFGGYALRQGLARQEDDRLWVQDADGLMALLATQRAAPVGEALVRA